LQMSEDYTDECACEVNNVSRTRSCRVINNTRCENTVLDTGSSVFRDLWQLNSLPHDRLLRRDPQANLITVPSGIL